MKILDIDKVDKDKIESYVYRFISNNQNRLPVCIISNDIELLKKSIMVLEEHDFKFRLKRLEIIVFE
jgi:late competence protein required for DNA uptake (superfamily II DNA/RNA helicase)